MHEFTSDLVALLCLVVAIRVREMNVAARILHHLLDVVASFANDVRVLGVWNVHFQSHAIALRYQADRRVTKALLVQTVLSLKQMLWLKMPLKSPNFTRCQIKKFLLDFSKQVVTGKEYLKSSAMIKTMKMSLDYKFHEQFCTQESISEQLITSKRATSC